MCCDALESTQQTYAFTAFERAFTDFGVPGGIRTDNGTPFASRSAFFDLSKLSVWWLRLGINLERIKPGHPTQNGRHERPGGHPTSSTRGRVKLLHPDAVNRRRSAPS